MEVEFSIGIEKFDEVFEIFVVVIEVDFWGSDVL